MALAVAGATVACALPLSAIALDWRATAARAANDPRHAQTLSWQAYSVIPSGDRFVQAVADARAGAGDELAQRRVGEAMAAGLHNDVGAWSDVYDIAPVWHAYALQQLALREQHRLDPLDFPVTPPQPVRVS